MPAVSVIVLTLNEEASLPACLTSVATLDADVVVVDSGSTDRTREIARAAGATVLEHPFEHYGAQRNWAQDHLPLPTEWLLHLDAGERLTPELAGEINAVLARAPGEAGFLLCRRTIFMGRWIRHGGHYPAYHLRLFRRGAGRCEPRLYDQHFVVDGPLGRLRHDFVDVTAENLETWTTRHARWAALEAREILTASSGPGRVRPRLGGTPIERRRWLRERVYARLPLLARSLGYGLYRYVARCGFLDGREGLVFHFLQGCWYRMLVDAMILESRRRERRPPAGAER